MTRADVIDVLAQRLLGRDVGHPLRVGIDGPCGSGKTTFRRTLAQRLRLGTRQVIEVDSDGFHHTRGIRYRQGRTSARGYYEDAYDFAALERRVLQPLGPGSAGGRRIALKVHDLLSDENVLEETTAEHDSIVLFDCTFLQRGALRDSWDDVIYLAVNGAVARARGVARDAAALGGTVAAGKAYDDRYLPAWAAYEIEEKPRDRATLVVDNTDVDRPRLLRSE